MSEKVFLSKNKLDFNSFSKIDSEEGIFYFESSIKLFLKELYNPDINFIEPADLPY